MKLSRVHALALALTIGALVLPLEASADPIVGGPSGTATGAFGEENGASTQGAPNGRTGAFNYELPITFPPARGQVQPSLAISYDSSTGDGEAGYGWHLSLPTISRYALSGAQRFGTEFQYSGNPLVKVCDAGGACGPEAMPAWFASGMSYYRLQADDAFMRFFYDPALQRWTVQEKGGVVSYFGGVGAMEVVPAGSTFQWHLALRQDPDSNTVKYAYTASTSGRLYLTDIWDTPRQITGDQATYSHHTRIAWTLVSDIIPGRRYARTTWVDVAPIDQVVNRITVASHTQNDHGAPREIVRQYQFHYFPPATSAVLSGNPDPSVAPFARHPFLKNVRMYGACGQHEDAVENSIQIECPGVNVPVEFEYSQGTKGSLGLPPDWTGPGLNADVGLIDVNRDGYPDVVEGPGTAGAPGIFINQSTPGGSSGKFVSKPVDMSALMGGAISQTTNTPFAQNTPYFFQNLDGAQTVLGAWGDSPLVRIVAGQRALAPGLVCSQPSGVGDGCSAWQWTELSGASPTLGAWVNGLPGWQWFADVDGDGYEDAFAQPSPPSTHAGRFATSTLSFSTTLPFQGRSSLSVAPSSKAPSTSEFVYQDVTGDGLPDMIWWDKLTAPTPRVWPGDGNGNFGCTIDSPYTPPCSIPSATSDLDWQAPTESYEITFDGDAPVTSKWLYFVDVNGDHLADVVQTDGSISNSTAADPIWAGAVSLWMNVDGLHFACANPASSSDASLGHVHCFAGALLDGRGLPRPQGPGERATSHPLTFADMDANGTTDLVVFGETGVFYLPFTQPTGVPGSSAMRAPTPGLLTKIRGGLGCLTSITNSH